MKAGYGKACITPPLGVACGLGLEDELVAILDDLFVRAVWVQARGTSALIIAADIIGLDPKDCHDLADRIAAEVAVPADIIVLHSTHTHQTANSRWESGQLLEPYGLSDQYSSLRFKAILTDGLVRAAREAISTARACCMSYGEAPVIGLASNRRIPSDHDLDHVIFRCSRPSADLRDAPEGVIDPLVRMVLFKEVDTGKLIGICNYNCHPTAAGGDEGPYATGDFPGVGMTIAETQVDGLRLLHLTGTCGEINPGKYVSSDSYAPEDRRKDTMGLGKRYADAIVSAAHSAYDWRDGDDLTLVRKGSVWLPVAATLPSELALLTQLQHEVTVYRRAKPAGLQIRGPCRGTISQLMVRRYTHQDKVPTEIAALRIGDVGFSFLPGEVFLQFGNALRERLGRPKLLNVAYCFGSNFGYVVPPAAFTQGGYEPTATALAPEAYDELLNEVESLLRSAGVYLPTPII